MGSMGRYTSLDLGVVSLDHGAPALAYSCPWLLFV